MEKPDSGKRMVPLYKIATMNFNNPQDFMK